MRKFCLAVLLALSSQVFAEDRHNYSMDQNFEYGYEVGQSDLDRLRGVESHAMIMVTYKGQVNGVHTWIMHVGQRYQIATCVSPCEFVRILNTNETLRAAPGTVLWAIVDDIVNKRLERMPY